LSSTRLNRAQIEACRRVLIRHLKKTAKIWTRVFPNVPVTAKPSETRIGKGKGNVDHWISRVSAGTILFEIQETNIVNSQPKLRPLEAKLAFKEVAQKLPCNTRLIIHK
jgi:large subunit ribosomal protein L16